MTIAWQKLIPHLSAFGLFLVLACFYFFPQLKGMEVSQGDLTQWKGMAQESRAFREKTGKETLWTNGAFGGMPTYLINTIATGNNLRYFDKIFRLGFDRPIGRFVAAMLGFYIMMILLGINPWLSMIGAIAFGFMTNNLVLFEAGHASKLRVISYLPLITAGILLAFKDKYLLGGLLFAFGMGLGIFANHPQMLYYFALTLPAFGIAALVKHIREKSLPSFFKACAALLVGAVLALGSTASNLLPTLEYQEDTMRGAPILETKGPIDPNNSSQTKGLAWNYAMAYSNNFNDLFSSFIPGFVGGGSLEKVSTSSPVAKNPQWRPLVQQYNMQAPLYWGGVGSTSGPIYFGAVIFFLFVLGIMVVKGPVKWWLAIGTLLTFMISLGPNLEFFNRFLFDYAPLFNKFRTPNSVLSVTSFLIPVLSIMAVQQFLNKEVQKADLLKGTLIAGGIVGGISLLMALMGPSLFDFSAQGDINFTQAGFAIDPLLDTRKSLMRSDAFRSFLLIGLAVGLLWFYAKEKLSQTYLILGLGILFTYDVWTIGHRYVDKDDFEAPRRLESAFAPRPADQEILQDQTKSFKVYDLSAGNPFVSTKASNFHQSLGGYSAAKLQRYQDIMDRYLAQGDQKVINMLNTRYYIVGEQGKPATAQLNPGAMGNAWFISRFIPVNNANEEIDALANFDPGSEAIVHQEFADYIKGLNPQKNGTIVLDEYQPNHLTYTSNTASDQFAVFSEIWYGPDKGWQAYIDGEKMPHIRVNYILRGLKIPPGQHKIEFKFDPQVYKTGTTISFISSLLILFGIIGLMVKGFPAWKKEWLTSPAVDAPVIQNKAPIAKTITKTKSKKKK
ncbi:MAG: YfhO family protein [Saprospiraceae bacterium]